MKKIIVFFSLFLSIAAGAQREIAEKYINTYKELAMAEMQRTGVPASIKLAQGILESQSGESNLAKTSNNHFGIKCKTEWTGAKTYHDDDEKSECFRVYPSVEDSYKDHSDFLRTRPNYAALFTLDPNDYEGWAYGLKKAGYATSSTYPQKLLKVISDYNLQQYSLAAMTRESLSNPPNNQSTEVKLTNEPFLSLQEKITKLDKENIFVKTSDESKTVEVTKKKTVSYPTGIFSINQSKVIYASEGTSLLLLANQFDLPLSKLIEFNDFPQMDILDKDRLVFIERKLKKGSTDFHSVNLGETLQDISQMEGVRLESLLVYNHLSKAAKIVSGDKIYLQPFTTSPTQPVKSPN